MNIGLLMKGFSYNEMLNWTDEKREWWHEQVMDYRKREKEEYDKQARRSKAAGRRGGGKGRRR